MSEPSIKHGSAQW